MIKHSIILISLIAILIIIGGYMARGYWAFGAELIAVPVLILVAYEVYKEMENEK